MTILGWGLACLVFIGSCGTLVAVALIMLEAARVLRWGRTEHLRDHEHLMREATRDPIFLLQERVAVWSEATCEGATYDHDVEGFVDADGRELTDDEAVEAGAGTWTWRTVTVFLTRSEGEAWAAARSYRYDNGTRVYCVAAEGEICEVLAAATVGGRYS